MSLASALKFAFTRPRRDVDEEHRYLFEAIRDRALITDRTQRIVSPHGGEQKWLLDLRRITVEGKALELIAQAFWDRFGGRAPFQVAGMEMAAVPLISAIALAGQRRGTPINAFIVRKERKTSGLARPIEGDVTSEPVVVVDDLVNSGSSIEKVRAVVADLGLVAQEVFCVIDFESARGLSWRQRTGVQVTSLFTAADFDLPVERGAHRPPSFVTTEAWRFTSPNPNLFLVAPRSTPATDGERIFVGSDAGTLWALDAATGEERWAFRAKGGGKKGIWSSPAVHDGRVYFGAYNGSVYCLDARTGKQVWRFTGAEWVGSSPCISPEAGLLFIGLEHAVAGQQGGIAALNLDTGARVWEHAVTGYVHGTPLVGPDAQWVACGSNDGDLWCLDVRSGKVRWRYCTGGEIKAAPAYDARRDALLACSFDGAVHVVEANSGAPLWQAQTDDALYTTPLVVGDCAYVGSTDKTLYKLHLPSQTITHRAMLGAKLFAAPRLVGDELVVGTTAGRVAFLNPDTLAILDTVQLPDRVVNAVLPLPEAGLLVIPTCDNRLFAVRREPQVQVQVTAVPQPPASAQGPQRPHRSELWSAYAEGAYFRLPAERGEGEREAGIPVRRLFGAAAMLWMDSPSHRSLPIAELATRLMPAIEAQQARVFLRGLAPVGLVTWARVSDEVAKKLATGALPSGDEWTSGARVWIVDVVGARGELRALVDVVRNHLFPDVEVMVRQPDGRSERLAPLIAG